MTYCFDSTEATNIPSDAEVVAGYVGGIWPTYFDLAHTNPNARRFSIAVNAYEDADWLDVEYGDAEPDQAPAWVLRQRSLNKDPGVYCSRLSKWPDVLAALARAAVRLPHFWIADYTNSAHLVEGSVMTQFEDAGPYDISLVDDAWLSPSTPAAPPTLEVTMPVSPAISFKPGQQDVFQVAGGNLWHKFLVEKGWRNECIAGPMGGVARITATFPDQVPQVSVLGGQAVVTVEDSNKRVFYFAQGPKSASWGVNELP